MSEAIKIHVIKMTRGFRLQFEPAQDAHVLLYPEGMIKLNDTATEILKHIDDMKTGSEVVGALKQQFPEAELESDVIEFLTTAKEHGWIQLG